MLHEHLDYIALGVLIFVFVTIFYAIIAVHDIPYEIAHRRNHPHQDAIHVAGWVSLFTLHAIWPFLWIWATLYRPERGWGISVSEAAQDAELKPTLDRLEQRISALEQEKIKPELGPEAQPPSRAEVLAPFARDDDKEPSTAWRKDQAARKKHA